MRCTITTTETGFDVRSCNADRGTLLRDCAITMSVESHRHRASTSDRLL